MRAAMIDAPLGDDVLGDDPTVNALEQKAAKLLGKQAALFVPSGTMGNTIAIRCHTRPGDEILYDHGAHSGWYEVGAPAVICAVQTRTFQSVRGVPYPNSIVAELREESLHTPATSLIILENTHNRAGGAVIPLEVHRDVYRQAAERGVRVHIDGARLFNAVVASGHSAAQFAACADSVSFCLSKGLGCPVGSMLCGTEEFIYQARRIRKMLGGGMRQVGVLAACGIVALDTMINRLAEDHVRARRLGEALAEIPGLEVDLETVQTNMVYATTSRPADEVIARMEAHGVRAISMGSHLVRWVTHCDVDDEGIDRAIAAAKAA
jgi:threonine aldolase